MRFAVLLMVLPTVTAADTDWTWTPTDYVLESAFVAASVVDWRQTKSPGAAELNPILGAHPSGRDIDLYFGASLMLHGAVAMALPKPYRTIWQCVWFGVEVHTVYRNQRAGIRIRF